MPNEFNPKGNPGGPPGYQIRLRGHLGEEWSGWFGSLTITLEENGETLLTSPSLDQAALHGLLKKVRDLGLTLVSITPVVQEKGINMDTNRKTAVWAGVLYIIGTVAGVLSVLVTQPVLNAPDYLSRIAANENPMIIGCLFVLTMGFALAMVPVLLFPILKRHSEALALGYVVFRGALETVAYIAMVICWLFLIVVSHEYAAVGASNSAGIQTLGAVFLKGNESISNLLVIIFSLDALILYTLLYRSRLVPRWISVWGFIAIIMHFSTAFLMMFRIIDVNTASIINLPIFLQEMVMAVWMIVKGFNPSAVAFEPR